VSLILEALKKVERERATPEQRGFLVLGPAAWSPSRSNLGWVLGMIAAAAVAGGAVYVLTRPPERVLHETAPPSPADRPEARPAAAPAQPVQETQPSRPRPVTDPPPVLPPARAAAVSEPAAPETVLHLHAISQQDGRPVAVVNDRVVREGDLFEGVRIVRIGVAEVEVEIAGARRILRF
jgi:hypothetical protein